jgi:molybdenum cofactor synthesis domain-containing protein
VSRAGAIIIGNEVLSGKVEEENARFLIRELREMGVKLERIVFLRDEVEEIASEVRRMSAAYDHVFTSGGVGSTHDDVTFLGVARAFGRELRLDPSLEAMLAERFGEKMNDVVRRMASVPEGSKLLYARPDRFPVLQVENVFVLPGVPLFFRAKFDEVLRDRLRGPAFVLRQVFISVQEDEIALHLEAVQRAHPDLELGSYPRFDDADHRVRLTVEGRDRDRVETAFAELLEGLSPGWVVRTE